MPFCVKYIINAPTCLPASVLLYLVTIYIYIINTYIFYICIYKIYVFIIYIYILTELLLSISGRGILQFSRGSLYSIYFSLYILNYRKPLHRLYTTRCHGKSIADTRQHNSLTNISVFIQFLMSVSHYLICIFYEVIICRVQPII